MIARRTFLGVSVGAFCALTGVAEAHAMLARAEPAVGATVHGPVTALRLRFTERLEPSFCRVTLEDGGGRLVEIASLETEDDGRMLVARVPRLAAGRYRVRWHVVSIDTHMTEGDYSFTLAP